MDITTGEWNMSRDAVPDHHVQITIYSDQTDARVATVFQTMGNAHLVTAAPDLLKAAEAAEAWLHEHASYMGREVEEGYAAICDGLRSAIAKAKGN